MTDSMKFGPEWLRNMNSDPSSLAKGAGGGGGGGSLKAVSSNNSDMVNDTTIIDTAPIIMAEYRYGREEMLILFNRFIVPPDPLKKMQGLYVETKQKPINLITLSEEETRMWNRGINSDAAIRLAKPGSGPGIGMPGTRGALGGRGGSVDRGRGRARGSYHYSRGLSYEDSDTSNGFNLRGGMRTFDRTQSQGNWNERNGGDTSDYTAASPRKEFGSRSLSDTNWRRQRGSGEDGEDAWRGAGSRTEKWGRTSSWRESESSSWERSNHNNHLPQRKPWEGDETNLPEWAMENPSERGGTFDTSGAFHSSAYSDDDDGELRPRSDATKNNTNGTSQPRPTNHSKKEPPNIPNGTSSSHSSSTGTAPLKQSQSATSLSAERRPTSHPITTSASFSGVDMHLSQPSKSSKPSRRDEIPIKSSPPISQEPPTSVQQPAETPSQLPAAVPPPVVEPKTIAKTSQEEEIEQRLLDAADVFVSRLMDEEDKDPPTTSSATVATPAPAPVHNQSSHTHDSLWYYQDPQGNVQGPFKSHEMAEWHTSGYFKNNLLVRRACDDRYSPLGELVDVWGGIPFMLDYHKIPAIKNSETVMPPLIDEGLLVQYQMQQQQQQRLMIQRVYAALSQNDQFNSLPAEQQQQCLAHQVQVEMNRLQPSLMSSQLRTAAQQPQATHTNPKVLATMHQLAQYQQHPQARTAPQVPLPVPSPAEPPPDPLLQLMQSKGLQASAPRPTPPPSETDTRSFEQFLNIFRQHQVNPPQTMESVWGGPNTAPNFPGWTAPPGQPSSLWVDQVGIKTEQEVLEEQLRAEEKKKEEELRKHEELLRIKEEEERLRRLKEEEELERRRLEEEEREKEKERKRMQEEEERKKKEAAAAKKAEQDRLRKEEEKKRKEEEKRRKEEEKRKQEEEKKRAEEEKKRLEEERKKREEIAKRQNEALKRLQEQQQQQQQQARAVKPAPAPWTTPEPAGTSIADIQKTERKQQQQLREQHEILKAFQEKHQQEQQLKNSKTLNLKWANSVGKNQSTGVKSLAEIQAEEHERMIKQTEKEKAERMAAAKDIPTTAPGSIWASAPQSLSWNSASGGVWGNTPTAVSGGPGFWEEASSKATKPQQHAQPAANKSQAKTKAKKEEASVMKLFEKQLPKSSKSEEFNRWCSKKLASCNSTIDIPTFVDFLLAFESQKEVREYIHMYLGNTQETNSFAAEFIERRSRLFSSADQPMARPDPPAPTHSNHFQEVKGKNKKVKKGKMTKVDSRILGFNVTAAPDRINVGDRDYGEGL